MNYAVRFKKAVLAALAVQQFYCHPSEQLLQIQNLLNLWASCNPKALNEFVQQELYDPSSLYKSFDEVLENKFDQFMRKLEWAASLDILKFIN